jgi:hypothetical protein
VRFLEGNLTVFNRNKFLNTTDSFLIISRKVILKPYIIGYNAIVKSHEINCAVGGALS